MVGTVPLVADDRPPLEMPSLSLRRRTKVVQPSPEHVPRTRRLPSVQLRGLPAASLTGVAVGGLAVLLVSLAGVGCEAVRGTSACGGGPGLLILRAVLAVLVLVFLLGSLDEGWTLVAVPVASAISYAASWWVTTAVGDDDPAAGTRAPASSYDVR